MNETGRALRALSDKIADRFKYFINEKQLTEVLTAELLPLFNAGMEQAYRDKETSVVKHMKGGWPDGCMCDPCVTVREAVNLAVAGAYAAAAKHKSRIYHKWQGQPLAYQILCDCGWKSAPLTEEDADSLEAWTGHILALTPADARQAIEEIRTEAFERGENEENHFIAKQLIASAEARARLEAAQLCDEMGRNGKGLFEASEALYKLAAARTPDSTKEPE